MKIFSDIGSKIVWFIIVLLLAGAGYVWVVRSFLNPPATTPPPVATNNPPAPSLPSSPATTDPSSIAASPSGGTSPTASPFAEPSPTLVPDSANSAPVNVNSSPTDPNASPMPALALPDQVALKVPQKLEKGGFLKIYDNNDGNDNPDPIMYSPSKIVKTQGLSLINLNRGQFQEVSGYFLVNQTGNYNFTIIPNLAPYLRLSDLRTRIDGTTLPNVKGGRVTLERGWHHISLFANVFNADSIGVTWGREGETLMPLAVWREAQ